MRIGRSFDQAPEDHLDPIKLPGIGALHADPFITIGDRRVAVPAAPTS